MHALVAIEMDRPGEERRRLVIVDLLLQQQRVGAEDHELLLRDIALHDLRHVTVEQGLAASDRDGGGTAIVDCFHALLEAQPLVEDRIGIVDLAAARAGEIAAQQRLEHQHQRIAAALDVLGQRIRADTGDLRKGESHRPGPNWRSRPRREAVRFSAPPAG